jgi:hypothetical protein
MNSRALILTQADFDALHKATPAHVEHHFASWLSDLHDLLNGLATLSQVQRIRGKRSGSRAFETEPRYCPEHWYTYHYGGRSEAQFNLGMFEDHLRMGIGFEPHRGGYGKPDLIRAAQKQFANALAGEEGGAEEFCKTNKFEVEVNAPGGGVEIKDIRHFLRVVNGDQAEERWIFVGRILRAGKDRHILENASAFRAEIERVFDVLWPHWLATQGKRR